MGNEITIIPTATMFYRDFDTRITLTKVPRNFNFRYEKYDHITMKLKYRVVKRYRSQVECDVNFYTSDESIINDILASKYTIVEIVRPLNQAHRDLLHDRDRSVVIRNKLWFNKYKHKITSWHSSDANTSIEESKAMVRWVYEHFPRKANRLVSQSHGYYWSHARLSPPPVIFTNSEETMMLMKLAYSGMLRMVLETCITLKELDN